MPKKRTIYKDEKYGKLTVIATTTDTNVLCMCDCGNTVSILKYNLTTGHSKSCGKGICQSQFVDLKDQQFGFLIVKELSHFDNHGAVWKCLCICGKESEIRGNSLKGGHTKSCGCKSAEFNSIAKSKEPGLSNITQLFNTYKNQARLREYNFELSLEEFSSLIKDNCYYCGIEPYQKIVVSNVMGDRILIYNGVDRIDNTQGYISGNVVTACGICNVAKKEMSLTDFTQWINRVAKHLSEKKL